MRHRRHHRKLNRTSEHRRALLKNMAQSMVEHGRVTTTVPKAKNLRPFIERLVTLAIKTRRLAGANDSAGALRARRGLVRMLGDRGIVPRDHQDAYDAMSDAKRAISMRMSSGRRYRTGEPKGRLAFTAESVTHRLIETIAPRFADRPGGYTRLIRLADRRVGDASRLAMLQFVGDEEAPASFAKPEKSARRCRADARYAMAIKLAKGRSEKRRTPAQHEAPESGGDADNAAPTDVNEKTDDAAGEAPADET